MLPGWTTDVSRNPVQSTEKEKKTRKKKKKSYVRKL
jgi:hypothetical protein